MAQCNHSKNNFNTFRLQNHTPKQIAQGYETIMNSNEEISYKTFSVSVWNKMTKYNKRYLKVPQWDNKDINIAKNRQLIKKWEEENLIIYIRGTGYYPPLLSFPWALEMEDKNPRTAIAEAIDNSKYTIGDKVIVIVNKDDEKKISIEENTIEIVVKDATVNRSFCDSAIVGYRTKQAGFKEFFDNDIYNSKSAALSKLIHTSICIDKEALNCLEENLSASLVVTMMSNKV